MAPLTLSPTSQRPALSAIRAAAGVAGPAWRPAPSLARAAHTSRRSPTRPSAVDEAAASASATSTSLKLPGDDAVIGIGFVVAAVALAMVTAGVAYLSFATWRDGRAEEEAAKAAEEAERRRAAADAARGKPPKRKDRKEVPSRGGGRGFGG